MNTNNQYQQLVDNLVELYAGNIIRRFSLPKNIDEEDLRQQIALIILDHQDSRSIELRLEEWLVKQQIFSNNEELVSEFAVRADDPMPWLLAKDLRDAIETALNMIDEIPRKIIRLRFGLDTGELLTVSEVGQILGIYPTVVAIKERDALTELQRLLKPHRNMIGHVEYGTRTHLGEMKEYIEKMRTK